MAPSPPAAPSRCPVADFVPLTAMRKSAPKTLPIASISPDRRPAWRSLQQCSQGDTGPFRIADCSEFPLRSLHLRNEKDPTIACAL
jgi:hypothetical protein